MAATTASTLLLDNAKGGDCDTTGRGEGREGRGENPTQNDHNDGDAMHGEAESEGDGELTKKAAHRKEAGSVATRSVSKRGDTLGTTAGGDAGRGRGIGGQQSKRRDGRSQGNVTFQDNAPATTSRPQQKRRFPPPEETKTTRTSPQPKSEEFSNSENAQNTPRPTSTSRAKKTGLDLRYTTTATEDKRRKKQEKTQPQSITDTTVAQNIATTEGKNVSTMTSDSSEERSLHEEEEASGHPSDADGTQAPKSKETAGGRGGLLCESVAENGCAAANSTGDKPCTKEGEEASPSEPDRIFGRAPSPRTPPRKTKGVPSSSAQLRQLPVSPRRGRANDSTHTGGSCKAIKTAGKELKNVSGAADKSRRTGNTQSLEVSTTEKNESPPSSDGAVGESTTGAAESVPRAEVAETTGCGEERKQFSKKTERARLTTQSHGKTLGVSSPGQVVRNATAQKSTNRLLGKTAKAKPALRGRGKYSTRLGLTMKLKQASTENCTDDATGPTPETIPPNSDVAAGGAKDAQEREKTEADNSLGGELGVESTSTNTNEKATGEGESEAGGTARGATMNVDVEDWTTTTEKIRQDSSSEMDHERTAASARGDKAAGNNGGGNEDVNKANGKTKGECGVEFIDASEQSVNGHSAGDDHFLPKRVADLAEALGVEVDRLRLEKAELEDTVAQLNVAAAQLYFVEYEQMKVCGGSMACTQNTRNTRRFRCRSNARLPCEPSSAMWKARTAL